MNSKRFLWLALGFCCLNAAAWPQEQHPTAVHLCDYLRLVGPRLGCHFTWESKEPPRGTTWKFLEMVTNDPNITSIPQLTAKLRHDLEGFTVEPDSKTPKIIHIVERTLAEDVDYPLNKRINLKYSGDLMRHGLWDAKHGDFVSSMALIETAAKEAPGIADQTEASGNWSGFGDYTTKITVNATNETVRNIFTDCIPLTNYSPVLWQAMATKLAGKPIVWVLFGGPKKP